VPTFKVSGRVNRFAQFLSRLWVVLALIWWATLMAVLVSPGVSFEAPGGLDGRRGSTSSASISPATTNLPLQSAGERCSTNGRHTRQIRMIQLPSSFSAPAKIESD